MGKQFTQEQFKKAIPGSGGIYATIAKRVGCSWHTAQSHIRDTPVLAQMYEDEANTVDDLAESVVIKHIQRGDINAAKWWLERRRRAKFATRVETELTGKDGGAVAFRDDTLLGLSDDDLRRNLAALGRVAALVALESGEPGDGDADGLAGADSTGEGE